MLTRAGFEDLRIQVSARLPVRAVFTTAFDPLVVGADGSRGS
ncbi:MAG TPA: hypothetical protein VIJ07_20675 [Dermatophilaceae bacterium]|jgi:hypothetical protein